MRGSCITPDWALNPLKLNAVQRHKGAAAPHSTRRNSRRSYYRRPRSADSSQSPSPHREHRLVKSPDPSMDSTSSNVRTARSILSGTRKRQQEFIRCNQHLAILGTPICATVSCTVLITLATAIVSKNGAVNYVPPGLQ